MDDREHGVGEVGRRVVGDGVELYFAVCKCGHRTLGFSRELLACAALLDHHVKAETPTATEVTALYSPMVRDIVHALIAYGCTAATSERVVNLIANAGSTAPFEVEESSAEALSRAIIGQANVSDETRSKLDDMLSGATGER